LKSKFESTLLPLELVIENGIGLGLRGITKEELSSGFLFDLKKSNIIMSFHVFSTGAIQAFQIKKMHTEDKSKGRKTQTKKVCEPQININY
jgi:hypothetical protein